MSDNTEVLCLVKNEKTYAELFEKKYLKKIREDGCVCYAVDISERVKLDLVRVKGRQMFLKSNMEIIKCHQESNCEYDLALLLTIVSNRLAELENKEGSTVYMTTLSGSEYIVDEQIHSIPLIKAVFCWMFGCSVFSNIPGFVNQIYTMLDLICSRALKNNFTVLSCFIHLNHDNVENSLLIIKGLPSKCYLEKNNESLAIYKSSSVQSITEGIYLNTPTFSNVSCATNSSQKSVNNVSIRQHIALSYPILFSEEFFTTCSFTIYQLIQFVKDKKI